MALELTPQQLITQSAQATTNAIASALTARMASISLPIYDWDSQDAYHSFSIFWCTLENWLLLNHILPDSKDHLRYVFAALGTKSLEDACTMDAYWQQRGTESNQGQKLLPSLTKSNRIWHMMSTPICTLENLKILWPGWERTPKISLHASRHWMDCCKMINDEHREHKLCLPYHLCILPWGKAPLGNLWPSHSGHPPVNWLAFLWTTLP